MPKAKTQKFEIHPPTLDDALDLAGILAAGGLVGQAGQALAKMQSENGSTNQGAALNALSSLVMGALASRDTRDQMRGFLFSIWKTTEDEQATEAEKGITDRLEPKYDDAGELDKQSPYYRKLKRFHALPPKALVGLVKAVYEEDGFEDFLVSLRAELPTISSGLATESNGATGLESVK